MSPKERRGQLVEAVFQSGGGTLTDCTERAFDKFIAEVSDAAKVVSPGVCGAYQAALTPFILPDPVDPLLIEARKLLAEEHRRGGFNFFNQGVMLMSGAGERVIMDGAMDGNGALQQYLRALRRGIELGRAQQ